MFSFELYTKYKEFINALPDPRIKTDLENDIKRKVSLLLERVPEDRWWLLLFRFLEAIDAARATFSLRPEVDGFAKEFGLTEIYVKANFDPQTGRVQTLSAAPHSHWLESGITLARSISLRASGGVANKAPVLK